MQKRIHFLDHLRTLSILFVVVIHSGLVYESALEGVWIVSDPIKNNNIALIRMYLDLFVMFTFFFVSGYFIKSSARKNTSLAFVLAKLKRIMLPWALAVFTLIPVYKMIFLASRGLPQQEWISYFHFFTRDGGNPGNFADNPVMNWLWFLPVLFLFQVIYLAMVKSNLLEKIKISLPKAVLFVFVVGVIYAMVISQMNLTGWHHSFFLHFQRERLLIYFMVFLLGTLCSKKKIFDTEKLSVKWYVWSNIGLTIGLLVFTALALNLFFNMIDPARNFFFISAIADRILYYSFMMISMFSFLHVLIYSFHRYLNKSTPFWRVLNKSAYHVYIIHMIIIGLLAWAMLPWSLPAFVKLFILLLGSFTISTLVVYLKDLLLGIWR